MSSESITELQPVFVWIIMALCVVAFILNVIVIILIVRGGNRRSSVDIFLINLSVADIILAGVVHPLHFKKVFINDGDFIGGNGTCKLFMFVPKFIIMSAVFTMVAVAADRYRVMIHQKHLDRRGALIVVCMIWIAAVCYSAPQFYEYNVYDVVDVSTNRTLNACGSEGIVEHFETVYAALYLLTYLVAFLLLNFWYGRISYYVWQHARRFQTEHALENGDAAFTNGGGRLEELASKRKIRVLKLLITVTASFVLLWTPYFILFAMKEILDMDHTTDFGTWPHLLARTMTVLNTLVNPTLYLIFCDPVKKAASKFFKTRGPVAVDAKIYATSEAEI